MEYRTSSGLIVTDRRHHVRGLPNLGNDGRLDTTPNETLPGLDTHTVPGESPETYAPISVGPNASDGFGNSHVMHPPGMSPSPWSGWPTGWTPPWSGGSAGYLGRFGSLVDIVYAAVDLNSSIIASMPPYIVKGTEPQPDLPWIDNPEPEVYPSWNAWAKEAWWCLVTCGEVFLYATESDNTGRPSRWMNLNPSFVNVDRIAGAIEYRVGGVVINPADVLHIKYVSWPGDLRGHGPLEVAGARLLAISAMLGYMANQATTGGIPPAILKHPKRLNRAQMKQMQTDWVEARMSALGLPAVLSDGTELDLLSPQLKDATISEAEKFSEARVSTLLGVPPFLMGLPSGDAGTYVNSTNIFDFHWRAYLRPRAEQMVTAMSGWILPAGEALELNRDEYIRPGMFERSQSYAMLIAAGVVTPEQVAQLERFSSTFAPAALTGATTAPGASPIGSNPYIAAADPMFAAGGRPATTNTQPNQ